MTEQAWEVRSVTEVPFYDHKPTVRKVSTKSPLRQAMESLSSEQALVIPWDGRTLSRSRLGVLCSIVGTSMQRQYHVVGDRNERIWVWWQETTR